MTYKVPKDLLSERELDMIRGKMLAGVATKKEQSSILTYLNVLEALIEDASDNDFYGTEGWRHAIGWD